MSLKEYIFKITALTFLMLFCYSFVHSIIGSIYIWEDFLSNLIYGTFLCLGFILNLKRILLILIFLIPFIILTFYISRIRSFYFILFYAILCYLIIFGKGIYHFLLNQNNTIHSYQIIINLTTIFISSFIFNSLLKKYLWENTN